MGRQYVSARSLLLTALVLMSVAGGIGVIFPPHIYPLAIVIGLIAVGLMIYSPISALVLYLVFFLCWPQEWAPGFNYLPPFTERIIGIMAIGSMAISLMVKQRSSFYLGRIGFGLVAFFVAMILTVFTAVWLTLFKDTIRDMLRFVIVFVLIANVVDSPGKLKTIVWLYFISIGVLATMSVVNYYNGIVQYTMGIVRALGLGLSYGHPNEQAGNLVLAMPLLFYYWKDCAKIVGRVLISGILLISIWNVILTGSRTGMIGILFLAGVIIMRSKKKLVFSFLAVILLLVAITIMPAQYKTRFMTTTDVASSEGLDESAQGRIEGVLHGMHLFAMSPLTGIGAGCFAVARGQEFGIYFSSHNMMAELIAETGLVGFFAYAFFTWALFTSLRDSRRYLKSRRDRPGNNFMFSLADGIWVSLVLLYLFGLTGHNLYRYNWFLFAGFLAVIHRMVIWRQESDEAEAAELEYDKTIGIEDATTNSV